MYRAKDQGRNRYQAYAADMHSAALARLSIEKLLYRALEAEEEPSSQDIAGELQDLRRAVDALREEFAAPLAAIKEAIRPHDREG